MRADDGDVAAQQMVNQRILVDPLDWMKDNGMVGNNQLCAQLLCLAQHLLGAVQRQQRTLHLLLTVTHQDTGVIKIHRQGKGRQPVDCFIDLQNRRHSGSSFALQLKIKASNQRQDFAGGLQIFGSKRRFPLLEQPF